MHRKKSYKSEFNYKHINIHKYTNCLFRLNINKIRNWLRHYLNKHNIKYNDLQFFPGFDIYIEGNRYPTDGAIYIDTKQKNNKWIKKLALICEQNERIFTLNKEYYNKFLDIYNKRHINQDDVLITNIFFNHYNKDNKQYNYL
ncbi:MAG: hypothetical protein J6D03_06990 [Clostridia bacterium]|nr:hypothetical protein [Clostridia bacterium]